MSTVHFDPIPLPFSLISSVCPYVFLSNSHPFLYWVQLVFPMCTWVQGCALPHGQTIRGLVPKEIDSSSISSLLLPVTPWFWMRSCKSFLPPTLECWLIEFCVGNHSCQLCHHFQKQNRANRTPVIFSKFLVHLLWVKNWEQFFIFFFLIFL